MRVILLCLLLLLPTPAMARVCESVKSCWNTVSCSNTLKQFTYAEFNTWLQSNKYADFDVIYTSSTSIKILIYDNNDCSLKHECWDDIGSCTNE